MHTEGGKRGGGERAKSERKGGRERRRVNENHGPRSEQVANVVVRVKTGKGICRAPKGDACGDDNSTRCSVSPARRTRLTSELIVVALEDRTRDTGDAQEKSLATRSCSLRASTQYMARARYIYTSIIRARC